MFLSRRMNIVLEEPCLYEQASRNYKSLNYRVFVCIFWKLFSLAAIHDPKLEKRIVPIGEYLFEGALRMNNHQKNPETPPKQPPPGPRPDTNEEPTPSEGMQPSHHRRPGRE